MMRRALRFAAVLSLLWLGLIAPAGFVSALFAAEEPSSTATRPEARPDDWWVARQKAFNDRVAQGGADLLLIGDSITQGWEGEGKDVWAKYYAPRRAVNLGIGGDRTQHVLWRLDHGNLDGIKPKLAVLMIGTNNSNGNDNTAEEIGAGIRAIVARLREKLPETKVLILAVFPRGPKPNAQRDKNAQASQLAAAAADGKNVFYLDIGPKFLTDDGTLTAEIMPDFLHLSPKGYALWAESIEPTVVELMGEKK